MQRVSAGNSMPRALPLQFTAQRTFRQRVVDKLESGLQEAGACAFKISSNVPRIFSQVPSTHAALQKQIAVPAALAESEYVTAVGEGEFSTDGVKLCGVALDL